MIHPKVSRYTLYKVDIKSVKKQSNILEKVLEDRKCICQKATMIIDLRCIQAFFLLFSKISIQPIPANHRCEILNKIVKMCKDGWIWLVSQTNDLVSQTSYKTTNLFFTWNLSHWAMIVQRGPTSHQALLNSGNHPCPLCLFAWQLPWQQPLLDQPPIHGMTLEWPLHGSVKHTNVDKEIQEGVLTIVITDTSGTLNCIVRKKEKERKKVFFPRC